MPTKNDKYTINIDFSAAYDGDKSDATVSIRDSEGVNISSHKSGDSKDKTDDILTALFDDVVNQIVNRKPKNKTREEELEEKLNSAVIDNKVLQARLNKLQAAYDAQVKSNERQTCAYKPESPYVVNRPKEDIANINVSKKPATKQAPKKPEPKTRKEAADAIFDEWYGKFLDNFFKL